MLQMWRVVSVLSLFGLVGVLSSQQTHRAPGDGIRTKARVVGVKYCRADAELFTVSLKLDVEIFNSSKVPIYLAPKMIPWVARVSANSHDANSGLYLYEATGSHYLQDSEPGEKLRIEPERTATLHLGYDLISRYDKAFKYPKSVSPGTYAVILVLGPEMEQPTDTAGERTVDRLTTEAFLIRVPQPPKVVDCEERGSKKQF